jgi:agmatinase
MTRAANFGSLPEEYSTVENAKVVVVPVPYDRTSTWLRGADKGPAAIVEASGHMELYDIETDSEVYRQGIFTAQAIDGALLPDDMVRIVRTRVRDYIEKDKFTVVVGGEHAVSIGSIWAHVEKNPGTTVLQLDAHLDLRDEYDGSKYNHACVMARVREFCPIVQVGIRSMDSCERQRMEQENIFFAKDIYPRSCLRQEEAGGWVSKVIERLSDKVYITIDLDVFDPAIMPSTGTPEPGGLQWYEVLGLLRAVCEQKSVVGFDVTELCPNERNKAPDFLAAKLIYKLLSYKYRD